jgi:hypothetical protein
MAVTRILRRLYNYICVACFALNVKRTHILLLADLTPEEGCHSKWENLALNFFYEVHHFSVVWISGALAGQVCPVGRGEPASLLWDLPAWRIWLLTWNILSST